MSLRPAGVAAVGVTARGWGWRHSTRHGWALRQVDLRIDPGERVLLLGPSGAGKSTLLAAMAGLLEPFGASGNSSGSGEQEGELCLDGVSARAARFAALDAGQARTGLVLQDPQAQTVMARCGDDVAFGLENHGVRVAELWPRAESAMRSVGLTFPLEHSTAYLSGGQRQRLALAGVLALRPGLLLLDEPTAQLDPDGALDLRDHVAGVVADTGATCVIVEHRVDLWLELVNRVVILEAGGGVRVDGRPDEVLHENADLLAAEGIWLPSGSGQTSALTIMAGLSRRPAPPDSARTLLQAQGLAVTRARGGPRVVTDVDLDIAEGTVTALVGPNGGGKSSLALTLAGLIAPSAGTLAATATLDPPRNRPPHRWRPDELVTRIGSVFQDPKVQFVTTTCADELALGPRLVGLPEARVTARVEELLDRLRLTPLAAANPFTLSIGEQRRLSVATALATRPRVLVLDEPTFGQDSRTWVELVRLLDDLRTQGTAVLLATHDPLLVELLADHVLSLRGGRMTRGELWPRPQRR